MRNPRGYSTARSSVEKTDHARYAAEPVADYWVALLRLVAHFDQTGEFYDAGPLPFVVSLVADLFWIHPEQVRTDLSQLRRAL